MPLTKIFSVLFLQLISSCLVAQAGLEQLIFQHVNEKNGLSNNIVNSITKDSKGFMWIATFDGLNRFDGTHFISFRNSRNQPGSLHQNTVHDICTDKNDDIWCATQTGISCFRQQAQVFETFFPETVQPNAAYSDIVCDAWGTIWCSGNFGLYRYIPQTKSFESYNSGGPAKRSLTANFIYKRGLALSPDKKSLWIATGKGINHLDIATNTIYNYNYNPGHWTVYDTITHYPVCFDRTGKLLYGSEEPGLVKQYDFTSNSITELDIPFSKKNNTLAPPAAFFVDKNNRYWISTWDYTLFVYDPGTKQVQEFYQDKDSPFSVNGDFFWDAYQDEEGTLWLGTVNGLSYTNPDITPYRLYNPLKNAGTDTRSSAINYYFEDAKQQWWFTCFDKYALFRYQPLTGAIKTFDLPEKDFGIRGITQFRDHLVLNTNTGIHALNMITGQREEIPAFTALKKIVGVQPVYVLNILHDSLVCLLTRRSGIMQYNLHTNEVKTISLQESDFLRRNIRNSRGSTFSSRGYLYMPFSSLKVGRYDLLQNRLDSLPISLDSKIKLVDGPVMNLEEDKNGNLWITLKETGLIFYDVLKEETKLWQQSDGLVFNHVFESAFDKNGKLWIAAYNKFSVYNPVINRFENFSLSISENKYAYGSRLINLRNGNILGNIDKTFIEWLPEKIKKNTSGQPVLINRLLVNDSSVSLNEPNSIKLNHTENSFTIEFGILTGLEKSRYRLEYKLDGFDDKWILASPLNTAVYTNVPEKKFVFRVRAISPDRSWQGRETVLSIDVVPPFYRTTWFRILAAVFLASIIAGLVRFRITIIRRAEKQKNDFNRRINEWRLKALRSQMNPHFIFNCMNSIDMYILKNDAENASRYLNKFAKLVRLILNQSDEVYVPLGKEVEMLRYYIDLEKLRFDSPFSHTIQVDNTIDIDETEIPSMLLQPYVENAIQHGLRHKKGKGHLSITIHRTETGLLCIIEDDGVGRERSAAINTTRSAKHDSKGSILTAERLTMLGTIQNRPIVNIIDLENEKANTTGTWVEINIPVEFD